MASSSKNPPPKNSPITDPPHTSPPTHGFLITVTPRPPYRWKILWLGLLALIFLGWAWHKSKDRFTVYRGDTPIGWLAVGQYQGQAGLFSSIFRPDSVGNTWRYILSDEQSTSDIFEKEWEAGSSQFGLIVAPHSRIILVLLIAWTALLIWRWRRIKHLTDPPAQPDLPP